MTTDLSDLNRQLAEKASGPESHPDPSSDMPDYTASIDAQIRDLDPLVEAKWGVPFSEHIHFSMERWFCHMGIRGHHALATGPTRTAARAAAILEALS